MFLLWGKHIRKYYPKYFIFVLIGMASLIAVDFFQLMIPDALGDVINTLKNTGTLDVYSQDFKNIIIKVIIVAIVMFVGRFLWRISLFFSSKKIEENIRFEMFEKAEELDVAYFRTTKVGNIMSWFTNDIETLEEFLGWGTLMAIDGVFLTLMALIKMFMASVPLTLFTLIPISLIALWGFICEKRMSIIWELRQESNDKIYDFSQESFTGIRVIKAFVKELQQIHAFSKLAAENRDINIKFTTFSVFFDSVIEIIIASVMLVILSVGGYIVIEGNLSAGTLVAFFGYFFTLIWPMIALGQVVTMFSKGRTSYKRIAHFLDSQPEVKDDKDCLSLDIKGKITFNHFSFTYPKEKEPYIKDVTLNINEGEKIGVIGTVGSGKSTLMSVLVHIFNVDRGTLFIDDVDIMDIKLSSLRKGISISPQDNFLFSSSIKDNIAFYDVDSDFNKVIEAAQFANIDEDIKSFEDGYDSMLGENGHTVSGGQKQRISLARAYITDSPILILDDSVSAVDLKTEEIILDNIKKKRSEKTTIIVASRVSTVMSMDRIIVLSKGQLEAFDTPQNLLKISPTFSSMVKLQELEKEKGGSYE